MDYHGIDMVGKLKVEMLPTKPTWTANDEGREIYTSDTGKRWYVVIRHGWIMTQQ